MWLENIYYIGQTIAVICVIGSLIFVGFQLREQIEAARSNATRDTVRDMRSLFERITLNESLAEISLRFNEDGHAALTPVEAARADANISSFFALWQNMFIEHQRHRLDEALWHSMSRLMMLMMSSKGPLEFWSTFKSSFTEDFRSHVDSLALESNATSGTPSPLSIDENSTLT